MGISYANQVNSAASLSVRLLEELNYLNRLYCKFEDGARLNEKSILSGGKDACDTVAFRGRTISRVGENLRRDACYFDHRQQREL